MARRPLSPPMTCPACAGHATTGYRNGRPQPCSKCDGKGTIEPKQPQRPAPTPAFAALIP